MPLIVDPILIWIAIAIIAILAIAMPAYTPYVVVTSVVAAVIVYGVGYLMRKERVKKEPKKIISEILNDVYCDECVDNS